MLKFYLNSQKCQNRRALLKKEVEDLLKFKMEIIVSKLNLVSREEFEVQKKIISKLQGEIDSLKIKKKKNLLKKN